MTAVERPPGITPELWESLGRNYDPAEADEYEQAALEDAAPTRIIDRLLETHQLAELPEPSWLINGFLPARGLTVMYGAPGAGKSFLAMSAAFSLATEVPLLGHLVPEQKRTLYVVGEGANGAYQRVQAWATHHKQKERTLDPVKWINGAVRLADNVDTAELADIMTSEHMDLLVIDTFARCTVGVDENSSKEVGQVIDNLGRIMNKSECAVLIVHHSGKDSSKGSRGSTALKGAADAELEVTSDQLIVRKMKDAAEEPPTRWKLEPAAQSVVPIYNTGASEELTNNDTIVLDALEGLCITDGHTVASGEWKAAAGIPDQSFYRSKRTLLGLDRVVQEGLDKQARYRPARQSQPEFEEF